MKPCLFLLIMASVSCNNVKHKEGVIGSATTEIEERNIVSVDFDGLEKYIDNHSSETLVINFWATWCKPCIQELPVFEKLGQLYGDEDVAVVLVSLDFPDQLEKLNAFVEKRNLLSEVVFLNDGNANEWIPKVDSTWSGAIPATLIRTNKNRSFYEQSFSYDELEEEVKTMIL